MSHETAAVKVFISYSHRDAAYLADDSLLGFLKGLNDEGIELWTDERIAAGASWDREIQERLRTSDVALVLVSQSFLDSPYCTKIEVSSFLEHCRSSGMVLFPVILSPCEWQRHEWLASRQFLPGGEETIEENYTDPGKRKRLFLRIREELRAAVEQVRQGRQAEALPAAAAKPAPGASLQAVAERLPLTALRCGLLATELDGEPIDAGDLPEVLREVMPEVHRICTEAVARFEGHLVRQAANGALACFGYPVAHEDDSRRAVRAALEIRAGVRGLDARSAQEMQVRLSLRAGVHAGQIVGLPAGTAGTAGAANPPDAASAASPENPEVNERIAQSETLAVAEYLCGVAAADTVVASEATHRRVDGFFETAPLPPVRLPGGAGDESVFQVLRDSGAETRFEVELQKGLTPFVGRADELALVLQRWAEARAGQGRLVTICAEAGAGKSRLLEEIRGRVSQEPCHWIECHCSAYHQGAALYPIVTLLTDWIRLDRESSSDERLRQLESHLQQFGVEREHVPLFAALLSIPCAGRYPPVEIDPKEQRRLILGLTAGLVIERTAEKPAVLVVEDLHWVDPSTLEWLGLVLDQLPGCPLLVLLAFRPEFTPPAAWLQRSDASHVALGRLDPGQVAEMVGKITGGKALPPEVEEEVLRKTEGLPLFVEDLTRMVLESGMVKEEDGALALTGPFRPLAIPDNMQEVLAARLAGLATARPVAQLGAAIGREFSNEMLREVAALDDAALAPELDRLVAAALLFRRGLLRRARYVWKHALVQDALVQSLPRRQRRQVHQRIAEVLVKSFPDVAESQPELVAYHLTEAGRTAEAVVYWLRAAQREAGSYAYVETIQHARRGLELLLELPESAERDRLELQLEAVQGPALLALKGWTAPETSACFGSALLLCRRVGSSAELAPIQAGLCTNLMMRARLQQALELGQVLLANAEAARDDGALVMAHAALCSAHFWRGELTAACEQARLGMAVYDLGKHHADLSRRLGLDPATGMTLCHALGLWQLGFPDQALAVVSESQRMAAAMTHRYSSTLMTGIATWVCVEMRMPRPEHDVESNMARMEGFPSLQTAARIVKGCVVAGLGRTEEGLAMLEGAVADWSAMGTRTFFCFNFCLLADVLLQAGRHDEALSLVERTLAAVPGQEDRNHWSELYRLKGDLLRLAGAPPAAVEEQLQRSLEIARQQAARAFELRSAMSLASLRAVRADQGSREEAHRQLAAVYDGFTEGLDTPDLVAARELLAELA
jgi:class 3 adenylate cyclase/tetratricopeptide (TPR) repeat protein